ncbi:MAG: TonB-dependent receptor [Opitutus sp.]|nr:TonB-dependent receptor [Opitutus sp.]
MKLPHATIARQTVWFAGLFASIGFVMAAPASTVGPNGTAAGIVRGQVSNAATGSFLQGAVVELAGANRSVITDREGRYQFGDVPVGSATLVVSFSGLDTQRVALSVGAGVSAVRDIALTSEIYKLDKFTVAGEREGTALAETLQRQAANVKAIVSSDTFGNVADGNIGDLLQHMAGMTANYNGHDVRQVSIRGVGAELNSVTMDGLQVASAQSGNGGRAFEFDQASLGNIETIEVTKAPTPDMDGASIGGSVNLVTKSAFDRAGGRVASYTFGFVTRSTHKASAPTWKAPVEGFGPSMNFSYSDVIGEKRNLGITLTGTVHSQPGAGSTTLQTYERKNDPGPVYDFSMGRRVENATRSRVASGLKLDYRWSPQTTVSLNTSYNYYFENPDTRLSTLATVGVATAATPQVLATVDASGRRTGGGYINPNYSNGITRVYAHPTLSTNAISINAWDNSGRTFLIQPTVRHRFDGLLIDYGLSYSNAAAYNGVPQNVISLRQGNIGWTVDRSKDGILPTITQTEGFDMYDLNNYTNLLLTQNDKRSKDVVKGGRFNLKKDLRLAVPAYLKTGFAFQRQERDLWGENRRYNYTGPDRIFGTADDNAGIGQFTDTTGYHRLDENATYRDRGGAPVWPTPYGIGRHLKDHPEYWKEDVAFGAPTSLQALKFVSEQIGAAYVMANARLGRVSVLTGVRMEDTRVEGEGPLNYISPAEKARRAASVGPVTDVENVRRAVAQFGGRATNHGRYRVVLPGLHLKYEPIAGLVTRASWSTGLGRPAFGSIIPNDTVNDDTMRVTVSNPNLKPQYGNNYDLTAEYYFRPQGAVSVGAFRKKIKDYIFTDSSQVIGNGTDNGFDGQYAGYGLTTQANGGSAQIEGLEFSYQQQLTFLPGWARGFGFSANFTSLKTEGNNSSLAGFVNKSGNVGLSYRGRGFDLRLQAVFRGEYQTNTNATPALVQYQKAKTTWGWKSRYAVTKRLSVFLDLDNIFSVPLDTIYAGYPDRVVNNRMFPIKIVAGVTGRL